MPISAAGRHEREQRVTGKNEGAPDAELFPELTRDVIDRMSNAKSARLQEVMAIVVRHLHAIVRESRLTQGEWWQAIDFLTRAGKMCSDSRQEIILLSDILGVSMLVDAVDNAAGPGISDSTVLGPFYAGHQRELAQGDSILLREEASEPLVMSGRVADPEGEPIAGADRGLADCSQSTV
jgi:Catechol dioxygenase N terminus